MFIYPNFIILRSHNYINIYDPLHDSAEKISNGEKARGKFAIVKISSFHAQCSNQCSISINTAQ